MIGYYVAYQIIKGIVNRIVPNLFCLGGDVVSNNGFGTYISEANFNKPLKPENYLLNHTVPGKSENILGIRL